MALTSRRVNVPPEAVFAVLEDGWSYCAWVVGSAKIRQVDDTWPAAGGKIDHSVGAWPLLIHDHTASLTYLPGQRLVLQARAWPAGEARVEIRAEPDPERGGSLVVIDEQVSTGPATWLPKRLSDALIHARNKESLSRLGALAEGRHGQRQHVSPMEAASRWS